MGPRPPAAAHAPAAAGCGRDGRGAARPERAAGLPPAARRGRPRAADPADRAQRGSTACWRWRWAPTTLSKPARCASCWRACRRCCAVPTWRRASRCWRWRRSTSARCASTSPRAACCATAASTCWSTVEYAVLAELVANPGWRSRERPLAASHGRSDGLLPRAIDVAVMRLRKRVEPDPRTRAFPDHPRARLHVRARDGGCRASAVAAQHAGPARSRRRA